MDLRRFVAETLREIIEGVADAQLAAEKRGAVVNPRPMGAKGADRTLSGAGIQPVEFDVAVTAAEGTKKRGGIAGGFFMIR